MSLLSPSVRSLGVIVLALVLLVGLLRLTLPGVFVALVTPLWAVGSAFTQGAGGIASLFGDKAQLIEERDRLAGENAQLYAQVQALSAELADVGRIASDGTGVLAGVLARPPLAPYDVLVLGAGTRHGIREGLFVYGSGGVPVGTITAVSNSSSHATLFSESGRRTMGWVGEERLPLTLVGEGAGAYRASVSKESAIAEGDEVYLPGPGAIPVGVVVRLTTDASTPEMELSIRPYVNVFSLSSVRVGPAAL